MTFGNIFIIFFINFSHKIWGNPPDSKVGGINPHPRLRLAAGAGIMSPSKMVVEQQFFGFPVLFSGPVSNFTQDITFFVTGTGKGRMPIPRIAADAEVLISKRVSFLVSFVAQFRKPVEPIFFEALGDWHANFQGDEAKARAENGKFIQLGGYDVSVDPKTGDFIKFNPTAVAIRVGLGIHF